MKFYDKNYVQGLIEKCEAFEADAEVLIAVLERRVNFHRISLEQKEALSSINSKESGRKITATRPFNLSQVGGSAFLNDKSLNMKHNPRPA